MTKVLIIATSRYTRGGITSVVKAHESGYQWEKYHCKWIQSHRDGGKVRKLWYLLASICEYLCLLPFYDIVHIHVGVRNSVRRKLIFAKIGKLFRKKVIVHFHPASERHLVDPKYINQFKSLFDLSDLMIVLAPYWMSVIKNTFPDRDYKMDYLYNPCPKVQRDFSKRENVILFAGTLIERKGYNRLLQAFSKISSKYPDWRLEFAGNGAIEKAKGIQQELGIPENQVAFLGWVSGSEKIETFQRASIYCLPSNGEGFPMGVLDAIAYGIPVVTTPVGDDVAMVHCNNCTSDINAWANIFKQYSEAIGAPVDTDKLYTTLFTAALDGAPDCGGLMGFNYFSGEPVTEFDEGRPVFARKVNADFSFANFMRLHLYSAVSTLKVGLDILLKDEGVKVDKLFGHGGFFKTKEVGQRIMSAATGGPITVMETAGEGGAWGMAVLALYLMKTGGDVLGTESLSDFLNGTIFGDEEGITITASDEEIKGFDEFMKTFTSAYGLETAAINSL